MDKIIKGYKRKIRSMNSEGLDTMKNAVEFDRMLYNMHKAFRTRGSEKEVREHFFEAVANLMILEKTFGPTIVNRLFREACLIIDINRYNKSIVLNTTRKMVCAFFKLNGRTVSRVYAKICHVKNFFTYSQDYHYTNRETVKLILIYSVKAVLFIGIEITSLFGLLNLSEQSGYDGHTVTVIIYILCIVSFILTTIVLFRALSDKLRRVKYFNLLTKFELL